MAPLAEKHILLVEDDPELSGLMSRYLSKYGAKIDVLSSGEHAIKTVMEQKPDVIILDASLPHTDGFTICREVRANYLGIIIMLTAREEDFDQVLGLEFGADDYLVKPTELRVLLARIQAHLRAKHRVGNKVAANPIDEKKLSFGQLCIDTVNRNIQFKQQDIPFSDTEFDLFVACASKAGEIVSRAYLLDCMRGIDYDGLNRSIDAKIVTIRKKLRDFTGNDEIIKTVRGKGYLFQSMPIT